MQRTLVSTLAVNNHIYQVTRRKDSGFYDILRDEQVLTSGPGLPAEPTAQGVYQTLEELDLLPAYQFIAPDFRNLAEVMIDGSWGDFTTKLGTTLRAADMTNAHKLALSFHQDFLGYLAIYHGRQPKRAVDHLVYSVLDTPAYATH